MKACKIKRIIFVNRNIACGIVGSTSDAKKIVTFIHQAGTYTRGVFENCNILGLPFYLRNSLSLGLSSPGYLYSKRSVELLEPCRIAAIHIGWNKKIGYKLTRDDYGGSAEDLKIACIGNNSTVSK